MNILNKKENKLFLILSGFFIANALIAEFIGIKIFSLENTLGIDSLRYKLFGEEMSFNLTAGVVLWPVVFVMTDIINEYYGTKGVRFLSYLTVGLISFAFVAVYASIHLAPAQWWVGSASDSGVPNFQMAFAKIFGQGLWIILGSLVAFLIGQIVDVAVFQRLKKITGDKKVWLRATGSTLVSQFIDSFVVLIIAFKLGADWSWSLVLAVGFNNYFYKFFVAVVLTPVIYLAHHFIDMYLGPELSDKMKTQAGE
ncbi:queuosine precursor transporter [Bacteroidia bacterium]|nr:queuosine precursor transporter [Bacteroidia bacterium]MDB9881591.1 queuosine precursor transporter [Bacteroidia bacterium]